MGSSKESSEDQDLAELRRNLATGSQKDAGDASSASELLLCFVFNAYSFARWCIVPSVVCYCMASIMMTVVNKVIDNVLLLCSVSDSMI